MNIKIIAVGKIKEQYFKNAIKEYEKRLSPFCSLSIIEISPEQNLDESMISKYKDIEADKIIRYIKNDSYVITLEINGKSLSSSDFAHKIQELSNMGISDLTFIIGGANGLDKKISNLASFKLSFSKMTFTHQMIRLFLIEQLYRAFKINSNEPYHR